MTIVGGWPPGPTAPADVPYVTSLRLPHPTRYCDGTGSSLRGNGRTAVPRSTAVRSWLKSVAWWSGWRKKGDVRHAAAGGGRSVSEDDSTTVFRRERTGVIFDGGSTIALISQSLMSPYLGKPASCRGTVPPSITYSVPVTAPALGDTTNAMSSATSRGFAGRPSGMPPSDRMMICLPPS